MGQLGPIFEQKWVYLRLFEAILGRLWGHLGTWISSCPVHPLKHGQKVWVRAIFWGFLGFWGFGSFVPGAFEAILVPKIGPKFVNFWVQFWISFFGVLELFGCLLGVFLGLLRLSWEASGPKNLKKLKVF